jgi:hypothetical protein
MQRYQILAQPIQWQAQKVCATVRHRVVVPKKQSDWQKRRLVYLV